MKKYTLILILISATSCTFLIKQTVGRYLINKRFRANSNIESRFSITLPYELLNGSLPCIQVKINDSDSTYLFLFDTGAFSSITNTSLRLNTEQKQKLLSQGTTTDNSDSIIDTRECLIQKMSIGNISFTNLKFNFYDQLINNKIDGILGMDFMEDKVFYFDKVNKLVTISSFSQNEHPNQSDVMVKKIHKSWDMRYYLYMNVFGEKFKVMLDTGCDGFLILDGTKLKNVPYTKSYLVKINGAFSSHYLIQNYYYQEDFFVFNKISSTATLLSGEKNLMGFDIFSKTNARIDFRKNKIYLYPSDDKLILGVNIPIQPISLGYEKGLIVSKIDVSLFNSLNLLPGDVIVSINQKKVPKELDSTQYFMNHLTESEDYSLEIQRKDSVFFCTVKKNMLIAK